MAAAVFSFPCFSETLKDFHLPPFQLALKTSLPFAPSSQDSSLLSLWMSRSTRSKAQSLKIKLLETELKSQALPSIKENWKQGLALGEGAVKNLANGSALQANVQSYDSNILPKE